MYATGKQDCSDWNSLFIFYKGVTCFSQPIVIIRFPYQYTAKSTNNKLEIRFVTKYKLFVKNYTVL